MEPQADANTPPPPAPRLQRRFPAGLWVLLGCAGLLGIAIIAGAIAVFSAVHKDRVNSNAVLFMKLAGDIPEFDRDSFFGDLFGNPPITVREHVSNLQRAAKDPRIKGVFLELELLNVGFGTIEELRDALTEFKKSGKFVVAYSEMMTEKEYALALAADEIFMPRDAYFEFNGLATSIGHLPGVLEKLGIEVQYFRYGKYKSASGESYGRKAFSEPVKEMISGNLKLVYGHFVDAVASFRSLDPDQVRSMLDAGHRRSDWAQENHLIDHLAYLDEVEALLAKRIGSKEAKPEYVGASRYRTVTDASVGIPSGKNVIALVYATGLIVSGKGGGDNQGSEPLIAAIRRAVEDTRVSAIVLRVNSPGGAGLGCDYVRREISLAKKVKPVIVSMSDVAASGGYWISMDATAIVAHPSTATGSIGVFSLVPNLNGLFQKIGYNSETFKEGLHADAVIGTRKMSDEESQLFDAEIHATYNRFVELAAEGRGMELARMQEIAQGRTWYGTEALERGLVDELGGFPTAFALAKQKAGIPADRPVKIELFDRKVNLLDRYLNDSDHPETLLSAAVLSNALRAVGFSERDANWLWLASFVREAVSRRETTFPLMEYPADYR